MNIKDTLLLFFLLLFSLQQSDAQETVENYILEYQTFSNDRMIHTENPIVLIANDDHSITTKTKDFSRQTNFPVEELYYQAKKKELLRLAQLQNGRRISMVETHNSTTPVFTTADRTRMIQGFLCYRATTEINSNTYELWYSKEPGVHGCPLGIGSELGLVLEIKRNNDFKVAVSKVNKKVQFDTADYIQLENTPILPALDYKDLLWKSRFTTIEIFKDETVQFTEHPADSDSIFRYGKGTILVRKIPFPKIPKGSQVFLDIEQSSKGDAYDRTGSFFLISDFQAENFLQALENGIQKLPIYKTREPYRNYQGVIATEAYTPLIEFMRFFTPFGIDAYNHIQLKNHDWQEKAFYRQEISEFAPLLTEGEWYVGLFIGNYDQGGHQVSARITIHPSNLTAPDLKVCMPLFNTVNVLEAEGQEYGTMFNSQDGVTVRFKLEEDVKNAVLRYVTTGHGGWGDGDEFNQRFNEIYLNNQLVHRYYPWRQDCGSFRMYNPASGNFDYGLSSSDLSRSNWCPGTVTSPDYIPLGNLKAGSHTLQIRIDQGRRQGTSFSYWNVSGVLLGY